MVGVGECGEWLSSAPCLGRGFPWHSRSSQPSREDFGVSCAGTKAMALETRVGTPQALIRVALLTAETPLLQYLHIATMAWCQLSCEPLLKH